MRTAIAPNFEIAEKRYPEILKRILAYTAYCDEHGDEDNLAYEKLEIELHELTGKEMSRFNLSEWWEEEGVEVLAFKIALPDPQKVNDLTREELAAIIRRIKTDNYPKNNTTEPCFSDVFSLYLDTCYYHPFLALNFEKYNHRYFQRNKDKKGCYFEYTSDEIVDLLWTK